jgi:hypothetical protein
LACCQNCLEIYKTVQNSNILFSHNASEKYTPLPAHVKPCLMNRIAQQIQTGSGSLNGRLRPWQRLDQLIESQPQGPAMVIKSEGKGNAHHEENGQHGLVTQVSQEQAREINDQNQELSRDYVGQDRSDKKSFFAFVNHIASAAPLFDMEGPLNN